MSRRLQTFRCIVHICEGYGLYLVVWPWSEFLNPTFKLISHIIRSQMSGNLVYIIPKPSNQYFITVIDFCFRYYSG